MLRACCCALVALGIVASLAAEDNSSTGDTDAVARSMATEVVTVYAGRREQTDQELPAMVGVVDADDADRLQAADVEDFLDDVSGVRLRDDVSGNEQRAYIRGFEEDQTLVLIDGRRQNMSTRDEGRFYIDPELLQSAEVVKSASSATYGSGAMAGVVAFETKSAADLLEAGDDSALITGLGYRDASSEVAPAVTGALRVNKLDFLVSASGRSSGNIQQGDGSELYTDDEMLSGLFKSSYNAGSYKFGFEAHTHNNNGRQADEDENDTETALTISDNQYSLRYQSFGKSNPLLNPKAHLYLNDTTYELEDLEGSSQGRIRGRDYSTLGATIDYQHRLGAIQQLAYGLEIYRDEQDGYDNTSSDGDRNLTPDGEATFSGIYLQDEIDLRIGVPLLKLEKLVRLIAALRYDTFAYDVDGVNSNGSQVSPKLGLNVIVNQSLNFFASWASAYRAPVFHEISGDSTDSYTILPNHDLDPETVNTIELGLAYQRRTSAGSFNIKGVYYDSIGEDYIADQTLSGNRDTDDELVIQYANINKASIRGFEIDGRLQQRALGLSASLARTSAKNSITDDYLEGNNVPLTLKTNLSYQIGSGAWGLRSLLVSEDDAYSDEAEYLPGYMVFDIYYSWSSGGGQRGLKFNSGVSNVFGESYYVSYAGDGVSDGGAVEEGRSYNLKLVYQW